MTNDNGNADNEVVCFQLPAAMLAEPEPEPEPEPHLGRMAAQEDAAGFAIAAMLVIIIILVCGSIGQIY